MSQKLLLATALFISALTISILNPSQVRAESILVVSFNTQAGTPKGLCRTPEQMIPEKWAKIEAIANWIVANKPDVALLQEVVTNCDLKEEEMLAQKLQEKGYPMDYVAQQEFRTHMNVATFSRYPILKDQVVEIIDYPQNPSRAFVMAPIQLPSGVLYTFNAHIRAAEPQRCPGLAALTQGALTKKNEMALVGGDFNLTMLGEPFTCPSELRDAFRSVYEFRGEGIDFLAVPINGPLRFESSWMGGSPASDHPAVWARIVVPEVNCRIQGVKKFYNTPETEIRVVIDGDNTLPTTSNPYSHIVTPGSHYVSVTPPTGTIAAYTLCYNRTDCHTQEPIVKSGVTVNCDKPGYIDLWWHFGVVNPSPSPSPRPVCENNPDIDRDGDVDIFDYNLLVGNFGKTISANNKNADIDCNLNIDIFDYNTLINAFINNI